MDSNGRTIWIAEAHRGGGKRFVVRANEKLTAFLELQRAVCIHLLSANHNRSDGCKRYVLRGEEKLTAFMELESAIHA